MERILTNSIYRSAEKDPDQIAFKQDNNQLSYQELVQRANSIANFLISQGVKKGDRIGIYMNRAFESAQVIYGIFAAGAAYVPIDSNLPPKRVIELLKDCQIRILFSKDQHADKVIKICDAYDALHCVAGIDNNEALANTHYSWNDILAMHSSRPNIQSLEDDIAYIMYTSGTTGRPKGIVHTQKSGCSYAKLSSQLYNISSQDILGNHSQLHYDISTLAYFTMPFVGGTSVIISEAYTLFPQSLASLIVKEKLTIWYSVPLALIQLIKADALNGKDLSKLRWILFGGEPFALHFVHKLMAFAPEAKYSNVYGPAEVNQCTYFNFTKDTALSEPIPIGYPWDETDIIIDYEQGDSEGDLGELLVDSSTQMKEYWNQEELTKSKMVIQENELDESKRYYKTGDIVRKSEDGKLHFLGRKDRQVKVRGYRVELNEIENILLSSDQIQEAAVYVRKKEDSLEIFVDLVVEDSSLTSDKILSYLSENLPRHALPSSIKITDMIPRTEAGKVDYQLLSR